MGRRTINERLNQMEPLLQQARLQPLTQVPAGVQVDGIWLTLVSQQETVKADKRQRLCHQPTGKRVVV